MQDDLTVIGGVETDWDYSDAFLGNVDERYNPGGVILALRRLACENGDFDILVEGFMRERSCASWFFSASDHVKSSLLAKTNEAARVLEKTYSEYGIAIDLLREAVGAEPFTVWDYAQCWPLLPYQVEALGAVVDGLAGREGVPLYYQGGRGVMAIVDHVLGVMRGAPPTALAPAWLLYDAYKCPGFETAGPISRLEGKRDAAFPENCGVEQHALLDDLTVYKTLALAPMLVDVPVTASVIAALMAEDVRADLQEGERRAAWALELLAGEGFAVRRGEGFVAALDEERGLEKLSGISEIFGVRVV